VPGALSPRSSTDAAQGAGSHADAAEADGPDLTAQEIYRRVAPSVAFVKTPLATGTAVVVRPGVALTNAHVVWPFDAVRLVFPDGSEIEEAPVIARDEMADLALISLPDAARSPADIADGTMLAVGSDLYLVGYPGESEEFPQPAISRGILSRLRQWDAVGLPYLQTDADIAGGQSGGALVASDGSVVGFSSMIFGDSAFGLAASAPEVMERVDHMLAGADVDGLPARPTAEPAMSSNQQSAFLDNYWDEAVFVLSAPYGTRAELAASSDGDRGAATLAALDPFGEVLFEDKGENGGEARGSFVVRRDGPHFIVVNLDGRGQVQLRSNLQVTPLEDVDDGAILTVGQTHTFLMDYPGDFDHFQLVLAPGQRVTVTVDTANFSPELIVEAPGRGGTPEGTETWVGGPLGLTASATFTAREAGSYTVVVDDVEGIGTGGYQLRVE
jgi:S1-C subfamily serine protease